MTNLKRIQQANKNFTKGIDTMRDFIVEWGEYWYGVCERGYLLPHEEQVLDEMMCFLSTVEDMMNE